MFDLAGHSVTVRGPRETEAQQGIELVVEEEELGAPLASFAGEWSGDTLTGMKEISRAPGLPDSAVNACEKTIQGAVDLARIEQDALSR